MSEATEAYGLQPPAPIVLHTVETLPHTRLQRIEERVRAYDPAAPQAAHLRPHQMEAVANFRAGVYEQAEGTISGGMAILHPTGSGKTVTMTEIVRIVCDSETPANRMRALILVPGHQILGQTVGTDDEMGAVNTFAPRLSVGEYSGRKKTVHNDVTVMNYQALPGAVMKGDIDKINPDIVICDEAHHVIDGVWARHVEQISDGRLLLGATATGAYSESRTVKRIFPNTLSHKNMKEGIEEGILSPLQGFVYRGQSRIYITHEGGEYADEDLFNAIANSPDNFLAAKICAQEVAQGRRGVVSCVPGYDRAHAKIMAEILSHTTVETAEGERTIRAAYVDGDLHPDALRRIFHEYKRGNIDVITYVNLLLEGWDSPETDFSVLLRPTRSRVLAEQRLGRTIRPREDKVATVHEIIYNIDGMIAPQITHMDIMEERVVRQGYQYSSKSLSDKQRQQSSSGRAFFADQFRLDPGISAKIHELEAAPLEEIRIACGQDTVPISWLTSSILATRFDMSLEEVEATLTEAVVLNRTTTYDEVTKTYYPPRAALVLAEKLGIEQLTPDQVTVSDILNRYHHLENRYARLSRTAIVKTLAKHGVAAQRFITPSGQVVEAFAANSLQVDPLEFTEIRLPKQNIRAAEPTTTIDARLLHNWLVHILVDPAQARSSEQRDIVAGQTALVKNLTGQQDVPRWLVKTVQAQVEQYELKPSEQMSKTMAIKGMDFVQLLTAALRARQNVYSMLYRRADMDDNPVSIHRSR